MAHPPPTPDEWLSRLEDRVLSALRELRGLYEQERTRREELERAYRRLKDLDELKTAFIARAGAELRQPLGLVIGFLEVALEHLKARADPESTKMLRAALRGAYRLLDFIAPLAAFAELHRQPTAFAEPVPLGQLVQELIRAHELERAERKIRFEVDLAPEAAQTAVDGPYGSYILRTLVDFLLAVHPEGERLGIRGQVKEHALLVEVVAPQLHLSGEIPAGLGEGVEGLSAPRAQAHLHPAVLGLIIARRAAQALGGDLFLRRDPAQGTALSVLLPARPLSIEDQIALLSQALERLPVPREEGPEGAAG